ncbi:MAG: class I poly(R)-hydroxyalkanoic acid synthase [Alphaproteobacteria bacterium]|nr:class I poly(R)-hydroxyalkanoic acid synthase [Alphaproteobacteria bacterium]
MGDQQGGNMNIPNPAELSKAMANIAERSQRIVADFLQRQTEGTKYGADPLQIGAAFMEMTTKLMSDPQKLVDAHMSLWQDYLALWQNTARRLLGESPEPVIVPDAADKRFKDEAWEKNEVFDYIKQSYLLSARWIQSVVKDVDGLDERTSKKVDFYTRQFVDAMAPTNFVATNPEVLRATIESGGDNLVKGLNNVLSDLERGKGQLRIRMTDMDAFKPGENIAATPGKVIYQNELMQLIQYTPSTEKVLKRPLMIVPPWINKFYIMDLRPKNSLIKWCVDQGHTVFVISWINPDEKLADKTFEDYMRLGPFQALDCIEKVTGEKQVNGLGYCLGGTLLASTLAVLSGKGDERIQSGTYFTCMLDFSEPGELGVFVDEAQIQLVEAKMQERGYLDGAEMATTFSMLRANDLIWSFVVNNYLLGKDPFPFDLLYWNSDSTRMPYAMHSYYLRNFYQANKLKDPGALTMNGVAVDLGKIKAPAYMLSAIEDHIAPWTSTYMGTQLFGGPVKFVLAASGHIAGVINPPNANKYHYWTNPKKPPKSSEAWFAGAAQQPGSWWGDWHDWVSKLAPETVPARVPGEGGLAVIEDAPGSYVRMRAI